MNFLIASLQLKNALFTVRVNTVQEFAPATGLTDGVCYCHDLELLLGMPEASMGDKLGRNAFLRNRKSSQLGKISAVDV